MRSIEVTRTGELSVRDSPEPEVSPGFVVLQVEAVGICGSDIHLIDGHFPSARYPVRPGHELTGTIVQSGSSAAELTPGTRVCVDPGIPCRMCRGCRSGRTNLCENRQALGITRPGGAAELALVPEENCYPVSAGLAPERAVFCEPLACVIHALDRIPGGAVPDRVVVFGAGTVGLLATQVLAHLGAGRVDVVEPNENRHPLAGKSASGEVATSPDSLDSDAGWDVVIDASGAPQAIRQAIRRVRRGGTYVQLGVAPVGATIPIEPYDLFARELTVVGSMTTLNSFARAVSMLEAGHVDVAPLAGRPYPLEAYAEAVAATRRGDEVKTLVRPGGTSGHDTVPRGSSAGST